MILLKLSNINALFVQVNGNEDNTSYMHRKIFQELNCIKN
jgi:hypothetical protein